MQREDNLRGLAKIIGLISIVIIHLYWYWLSDHFKISEIRLQDGREYFNLTKLKDELLQNPLCIMNIRENVIHLVENQ
ncbi:hypothetical protein [Chryseobacterium luteum]|uniref:Uncharacterized protein n=1 Tax=Chryseobacterium luteum TaxID=421531 RepID=A0A085ZEJ1_9FLAO|nr:hypothetical protein [Chryseobacterium luteum]KFF02855.1 hypothetical protein IX38_12920 [Chryseobacterium luteum]